MATIRDISVTKWSKHSTPFITQYSKYVCDIHKVWCIYTGFHDRQVWISQLPGVFPPIYRLIWYFTKWQVLKQEPFYLFFFFFLIKIAAVVEGKLSDSLFFLRNSQEDRLFIVLNNSKHGWFDRFIILYTEINGSDGGKLYYIQ